MIDFIAFAFMVTGWVIYFINSTTHSRIQVATSNAHVQAETGLDSKGAGLDSKGAGLDSKMQRQTACSR